jgi:hypothetical protein
LALLLLLAAPAAARELRLTVAQTMTLPYPGASAAFAVDAAVVDASAVGGELVLVGRRAGSSVVTVVTPEGAEAIAVRVEGPAARALAGVPASRRSAGSWEGRYESGNRRLSSSLAVTSRAGERTASLRLFGVGERPDGGRTVRAFPAASLELSAPGRSLVLLDELVEASPLTLDGTVLRGLHLRRGPLAIHAGVASATPWDDVLLPADGDRALDLSYRFGGGANRWVPALLWLPDAARDFPGVASLGFERGTPADALRLRAELGWSSAPGGAIDFAYQGARQHGWLQGEYRPAKFAALGVARPPGTFLDGAWSASRGRATADVSLSTSALDLVGHRQQAQTGRAELRFHATDRWTLSGGLGAGGYRDRERADLRRLALSLGGAFDSSSVGIATLYRYQRTSAASRGGHGGRVTVRTGAGAWRGHLFVDAQQDSPTVDLVLRSRPGLERAFAELGLSAGSPEEVVRLLRDNAALLAGEGVDVGALDLAPLRVQSGGDLAWRGGGARRPELALRVVLDEARGIAERRRAYLATLSGSARLFGDTDLVVGYTRWASAGQGFAGSTRGSVDVAVRTKLSEGQLAALGSHSIRGSVQRDDGARGDLSLPLLPLGGVEVVLDGNRRTRTDSDGGFIFDPVRGGSHRVEVVLPAIPGAYFTTPSAVTLEAGGRARFAITFSSARLSGHVRDDGGRALAGVTVRIEGASSASATTDSEGAFAVGAAGGDTRIWLVADSLPAGFDLAALRTATLRLQAGAPAACDFTVPAQRSVSGIVRSPSASMVSVVVEGTTRSVTPDRDGRFVLRGLPAGTVTLVARGKRGEVRRAVELGAGPSAVTGVEMALP